MNCFYNDELLSLNWKKEEENVSDSGNEIRRFTSLEGASAILIGGLEYNESDIFSRPTLAGFLILIPPPTWIAHPIAKDYDGYDVLTKDDIVGFLIENLEKL